VSHKKAQEETQPQKGTKSTKVKRVLLNDFKQYPSSLLLLLRFSFVLFVPFCG